MLHLALMLEFKKVPFIGTTSSIGCDIARLIGADTAAHLFGNQVVYGGLSFAQTFNTWPTFTNASAFTTATNNVVPAIGINVA